MLRRLAGFEIIAEVGRGAMATVYHARPLEPQDSMPDEVAIKVLRPQYLSDLGFRARFEREGQTITALQHPAIIAVYAFGQQGDQLYIAMAYMPHGSLAERLLRGQLPVEEAMAILARVGVALDYAHGQGVIHRDLKPSNVLFDGRDQAFLTDFGIAHALERSQGGAETISGTPAYMSPEQARGERSIGPASDIYALGVLAFELLVGRLPFRAETAVAILLQHMEEPPPRPSQLNPSLPAAVDAVLMKALAKDPAQRYEKATAMIAELRRALEGRMGALEPWPAPVAGDAQSNGPQHDALAAANEEPDAVHGARERGAAARLWVAGLAHRARMASATVRQGLAKRPAMAFSLVTMLALVSACLLVGALRGSMIAGREGGRPGSDEPPGAAATGIVDPIGGSVYLPLMPYVEGSADEGATAAATVAAAEATTAPNVRMLVGGESVTLLNISGGAVALSALTLQRVNRDGEVAATFELRGLRRVAGNAVNALPPGDCLQVWHYEALVGRGPQKPASCDTLRGWLATRNTAPLFQGVQEGDAFEVFQGERRLVRCAIAEERCDFSTTAE